MKRKILLLLLALGFLGCISAQTPRMLDNGFILMPNPHHLSFTPIKKSLPALKSLATKAIPKLANTEQNIYQVDIVLDFNINSQDARQILLFNEDAKISKTRGLTQGSNIMTVPEGTYDVMVVFYENITPCYLTVIREQVDINQDVTLNITSTEANNHIHLQTLTIDGEPVYTGRYSVDQYGNTILLESGNTEDVVSLNYIFCKNYGSVFNFAGNFGAQYINGETILTEGNGTNVDFFVNDLSDRYSLYCARMAYNGQNAYASSYEVSGASGNRTITNDPTKYAMFEDPFIIPNQQNADHFRSFSMFVKQELDGFSNGVAVFDTIPLTMGGTIQYYLGADMEDSQAGYISYFEPKVSSIQNGRFNPVVVCSPCIKKGDEALILNNGAASYTELNGPDFGVEYSEELDAYGRDIKHFPFWPGHPAFSYSIEKKKGNFFNNAPVFVSAPWQYRVTYSDGGQEYSECGFEFDFDYIGRYGEKVVDNFLTPHVEMTINGEDWYSGQGLFYSELDNPISGIVDIFITNENVEVDEMIGTNRAQLHYTAGADDETPPTMTMLHFKTANDDVTDRFESADEGVLEFSAGDFNFTITPLLEIAYDRFAPESVEVSYSPYGEDNWNELPVEEVPENYWPVMGWFYTGSLAVVTGEALNGWFDLKVKLTDAAGNWQEQVISPAFRIDNLAYSSVATVSSENAREVARYNLAGQRVDANATGVVIVKMSDGTAHKVLMK